MKQPPALIGYNELLGRFELAFYRLLAPEVAAECEQKQALLADGANPNSVRELFDLDYWLVEQGVYILVRADYVFEQRFPGLRYVAKRFDQYLGAFDRPVRNTVPEHYPIFKSSYWLAAQSQLPLATAYVSQRDNDYTSQMFSIEFGVALMQHHFEHPTCIAPENQREALRLLANFLAALDRYAPQVSARLRSAGAPVLDKRHRAWRASEGVLTPAGEEWACPRDVWGNL